MPVWRHVKTKLADIDRAGLLGLLQDLYAASKDNKAFLHAIRAGRRPAGTVQDHDHTVD